MYREWHDSVTLFYGLQSQLLCYILSCILLGVSHCADRGSKVSCYSEAQKAFSCDSSYVEDDRIVGL